MRTHRRRPRSEADVQLSRARVALNAALDALGGRQPDENELPGLVALAARAFVPGSAASRLVAILWNSKEKNR